MFVLPAVTLTGVLFFVPLVMLVWISVNDWPLAGVHHFIGLANYKQAFDDTTFWHAMVFTAEYTVVAAPAVVIVGYGLAMIVRRRLPGVGFLRSAYFLPFVVGMATASYMFSLELNPSIGLYSTLSRSLGLSNGNVSWLLHPTSALLSVAAMSTWKTVGFAMIILMSGMQAVPEEVIEASRIDGAGPVRRELYIIAPLIRRYLVLSLVISVIGSFLAFDQFFILTDGGPAGATVTVIMYIYQVAFSNFQVGYAAALSIIVLVVVLAMTVCQFWLTRGDVE